MLGALTWARDGRSIVGWGPEANLFMTYLWRVWVDGERPVERVEIAGMNTARPTIAATGDRLAFSRSESDVDVFRFQEGQSAKRVISSSFLDFSPQVSADARRLAFNSNRSGDVRLWLAGLDGASALQLTAGPGDWQGSAHWSPDSRQIYSHAHMADGSWHVWMIGADGGDLRQVTSSAGAQNMPSWSRVWKLDLLHRGRRHPAERTADSCGWRRPARTADARRYRLVRDRIIRRKAPSVSAGRRGRASITVPLAGGSPTELASCAQDTAFASELRGIYYVACDAGPSPAVILIDPVTGRKRTLGRLENFDTGTFASGLAVSPDGRSIYYPRNTDQRADLMLIENFK